MLFLAQISCIFPVSCEDGDPQNGGNWKMTQAEKEVVLSLRQQHYSYSAIAKSTGLPLGTIKSFLSRVGGKIEGQAPASVSRVTVKHNCCRQCGAPLDQPQRGKIRTFCNDRCRAAYWNKHRDLSQRVSAHRQKCEICGCYFFTYHGRYCSRACYGQARSLKAGVTRG